MSLKRQTETTARDKNQLNDQAVTLKGRTIRKLMGGGGGRAKYKKKIRARKNLIKKILARQLTLRNIHARA